VPSRWTPLPGGLREICKYVAPLLLFRHTLFPPRNPGTLVQNTYLHAHLYLRSHVGVYVRIQTACMNGLRYTLYRYAKVQRNIPRALYCCGLVHTYILRSHWTTVLRCESQAPYSASLTWTPLPDAMVILQSYLTSRPSNAGSSSRTAYVCSSLVRKYDAWVNASCSGRVPSAVCPRA